MQKNIASQQFIVFAWNVTTNLPVTGDAANITATISKDFAADVATDDVNPTETQKGFYVFDATQAESNANDIQIFPSSVTADTQVISVPGLITTVPVTFGDGIIQTVDNNIKISKIPLSDGVITWNSTALASINAECDTALTDYDGPTNAEMIARTRLDADYFSWATDAVATVTNVTNDVGITQAGADKAWSTTTRVLTAGTNLNDITAASVWAVATRVLTAGTNIVLAKGVGVTGFNDIAATDIVTGGAITTSSGNASVDVVRINGTLVIGAGVGGNLWRA